MRLVFELVVHTLVCLWPRHVGCVVWHGWRRMRPGYFRWGSGDEFSLRTSLGSLSVAHMVDVVCTDVAENALPTPVLSNGIGLGGGSVMVWGGIAHGIKSQLIIVAGNMTAVRYRDEILRPVAVPLVQQRNLILQQDNARPHVARVCQDFLANNNIAPLAWPPYSPDLTPTEHMWDELDRRVRKRRNPPATLAQLRNAVDRWME